MLEFVDSDLYFVQDPTGSGYGSSYLKKKHKKKQTERRTSRKVDRKSGFFYKRTIYTVKTVI